jgi:hypothetical protein
MTALRTMNLSKKSDKSTPMEFKEVNKRPIRLTPITDAYLEVRNKGNKENFHFSDQLIKQFNSKYVYLSFLGAATRLGETLTSRFLSEQKKRTSWHVMNHWK